MKFQAELLESIDWKLELKNTALKYHTIGAWVAIIFNLLFFVTDYINLPEHWLDFLTFRVCVSLTTLATLLLKDRLNLKVETIVFIPFLLISIQNAYMWSFMDAAGVQKHAFAYFALFIGGGMLILWTTYFSIVLVILSIISNVFFFWLNSTLSVDQILANGGLLTVVVMVFSIFLIYTRYNLTKKEIIARLSLKESYEKLNEQKEIIESKNKNILSSINYAKRIQNAILPPNSLLKKHFSEHFIIFKPKDIVSGDFYWFSNKGDKSIIVAADCTGHGVPGAFMSMIGNSLLNKLIVDFSHRQPADILYKLRQEVISAVSQGGYDEPESQDGMDIAICAIDHESNYIEYSGAFNSLYIVRNGELLETKANRMPIGRYLKKDKDPFTNHKIKIEKGDAVYLFSDGFPDQFGGPDNKKIGSKRFKELFVSLAGQSMDKQKEKLENHFEEWKGEVGQLDDVLVIGFRL